MFSIPSWSRRSTLARPIARIDGRRIRARTMNAVPTWATCATNASATTPADNVLRKKLVRRLASLIAAERAPCRVKCSVDTIVNRSCRDASGSRSMVPDLRS
jgi:hypothetical protein